jgi:hypothetical protein
MTVTTERPADAVVIRAFTIGVFEADLEDLRARMAATRWPEGDRRRPTQGASLKET